MKEDTARYVMAISLRHLNLSQSPAATSAGVPGDSLSEEAFGTAGFVSWASFGASESLQNERQLTH